MSKFNDEPSPAIRRAKAKVAAWKRWRSYPRSMDDARDMVKAMILAQGGRVSHHKPSEITLAAKALIERGFGRVQ